MKIVILKKAPAKKTVAEGEKESKENKENKTSRNIHTLNLESA